MRSPRQVEKAQLVVAVQAHQVLVRLPVVVELQVAQAAVLDLVPAVQQVALVVELPAEQAARLEVQVAPQAELLVVQPAVVQPAVLRQAVPRVRQRPVV